MMSMVLMILLVAVAAVGCPAGAFFGSAVLFRQRLQRELADWIAEGVISEEQAAHLRTRYNLNDLPAESARLFFSTIYTIGALLVGGGVISFVAAHWTGMGVWLKVGLIVGAMLAAHAAGYYLWRVKGSRPMLGHSLVLLGTLIFGANIGLLAQIFHIQSDFYNGFAAWALGALAVALALGSVPNFVLALLASFVWFYGALPDRVQLAVFYPLIALAVGCTFAVVCRSGLAFSLTLAASGVAFIGAAAHNAGTAWAGVGAAIAIGFLYATWGHAASLNARWERFVLPAKGLGLLGLAATAYVLSFEEGAREMMREMPTMRHMLWLWPVGLAALAGLVLWAMYWRQLFRQRDSLPLTVAGLVLVALLSAGLVLREPYPGMLCANAAALALSAGLIWVGVEAMRRSSFWAGVLYIGLLIVSRFLEYETGLIVKSAVLVGCGIAVVAAGVVFERCLQQRRVQHV